jgi:hypothetical protein
MESHTSIQSLHYRFGLWILSGHGCAGLCGPRFRWQEEDAEKTASLYDDNGEIDLDTLPWIWKECTQLRLQDAYDFCLPKHTKRGSKRDVSNIEEPKVPVSGMEHVFAAVGLPSGPQPARRGVLSDRLFETPPPDVEPFPEVSEKIQPKSPLDFSSVIPPVRETRDVGLAGPLKDLPYPFIGHRGAQVSSEEQVPFPPSPRNSNSNESDEEQDEDGDKENINIDVESGTHDDEDMEGLDVEEDEEDPSDERRTSGSLSSLGQPVPSRYPFQYRRPRGGSSLSSRSHMTPQSIKTHSTRTGSTPSRSTQSTGNIESSDSPWSNISSISPRSHESNGIPMPPRHPQAQQRRPRAGTVPASPTPVYPPRRRPRTRTSSGSTSASRLEPSPLYESSAEEEEEQRMEQPEAEGPHEEAEREDSLGLLSVAPSPRTSLIGVRRRPSNLSRHRYGSGSSSSKSHSQGRSPATSLHSGARSRAQSLIHSLNAASQSSLDLVRSRANSMARLSDSPWHSQSEASPSSPENNTFGQPLRSDWRTPSNLVEARSAHGDPSSDSSSVLDLSIPELRVFPTTAPSVLESEDGTIVRELPGQSLPVPVPGRGLLVGDSQPDISTAAQSFITAPATIHGSTTTDSDGVIGTTPPGWATGQPHGGHFDGSMRPV